jgi:Ca-activated chloride channel family protein
MKRFLKHDRYELSDRERENIWYTIRRELNPDARTPWFSMRALRPALAGIATVAALAMLGVWWIGSDQPDQLQTPSGGLLAEAPETGMLEDRSFKDKAPGTESFDEVEVAAIEPEVALASRGALEPAPVADMATEKSVARAQAPAGISFSGRIVDQETGEGLAYANVLIRGTSRGVVADSSGVFHLENLPPGQDLTLVIMMLGYAPFEQQVNIPDEGPFEYAFNLEPVIVETLQAFDVAGAEYMVEVKEAVGERPQSQGSLSDKDLGATGRRENDLLTPKSQAVNTPLRTGGAIHQPAPSAEEALKRAQTGPDGWGSGGSVTGGTKPPNGAQVELMYFEHTGVNPFVATEDDSLSTFAVDVDNASWAMARNYLSRGMLPPKDAIRVEEFVNTFDPGWARHTDEVFRIHSDGSVSRFGDGYHLLRIGLVGKTVKDENRKAANLIFVIDISGSMNRENRLGAVKKSLHILLDELSEGDRVGLVVYGSQGEIRLEPTDISRREVIVQAIDGLVSNGSTNVHEGLELAYGMARKYYEPAKVNRLILCSDGVANNGGSTEAEEILSLVRKASDEGITISTIGFGMGNYNDVLMEKLADKGDGNYYYVDGQEEAERVFKENLTGLLQTIAREVKVQVEFDTRVVKRWRLLGYENRDVADRDFRNDAVDAGEVGSGHQVTALYELKLAHAPQGADEAVREGPPIRVGTVRLRHEAPAHDTARAGQVEEIEQTLLLSQLVGDFASGTVWMRAQMVAAEFAEILRGSYWAKESRLADLVPVADGLAAEMPGDPLIRDLADMIRKATDLQAAEPDAPEVESPDPYEKDE